MRIDARHWVFISLVAVVLLGSAFLFLYTSPERDTVVLDARGQANVHIVLTDEGFVPQHIRILKGTTVTYTTTRTNEFWPASNTHPSHFIYPEFDPKEPIQADGSWSFTFERVGVWGYHDHVRSYFTGIIYVDP